MTVQRTMRLKQMLSSHRDRLLGEIAEVRRQARDEGRDLHAGDILERVERVQDEDVAYAVLGMKTETVHRIDDALLRLDAGTFGLCADCDQEIAEGRLQAVPFATRCRECQETAEERELPRLRQAQVSAYATGAGF